jgi:NTP pyrophosphatase (non-canonical NTP hydrolase)
VHELEQGTGLTVRRLVEEAHKNAVRHMFWEDVDYIHRQDEGTGKAMTNALCTRLLLIVSEATEAMDALRSGTEDDFGEELADIVIRVADLAGGMGIDLEAEIAAKMERNKARPPKHGKQF